MKLSRRGMLALAGAGAALSQAAPQPPSTTPAAPPATNPDPVAAAREQNRRSAEDLARFDLPMSAEPAFIFRA